MVDEVFEYRTVSGGREIVIKYTYDDNDCILLEFPNEYADDVLFT